MVEALGHPLKWWPHFFLEGGIADADFTPVALVAEVHTGMRRLEALDKEFTIGGEADTEEGLGGDIEFD